MNAVIRTVVAEWQGLKLVNGKPRHSQSQGSVERANEDIEAMLATWMSDNNTKEWSNALNTIQFMKNRSLHAGLKMSPYKAMFGLEPQVGLSTTNLPPETVAEIVNEEDLEHLLENNNIDCSEHLENSTDCSEPNPDSHILEDRSMQIAEVRNKAAKNLQEQARKMLKMSDAKYAPCVVGTNVTVPIPDVDRARGSFRNVIAVVMEVNEDNSTYKLGTKDGVLQQLYARSQFDPCTNSDFLHINDIPNKSTSLRKAASIASGTMQGYKRCNCTKFCRSNSCNCKKYGRLCNSKCHHSSSCSNK